MGTSCDGRHMCEPPRWPKTAGERWACEDCGRAHISKRVLDMSLAKHIRPNVASDAIGWTTRGAS